MEQTSCDGVLNGSHANHRRVLVDAFVNLLKRLAAEQLQLLALEILVGGDVVKRAYLALYGYSFHTVYDNIATLGSVAYYGAKLVLLGFMAKQIAGNYVLL
jgi:hypothetical protein